MRLAVAMLLLLSGCDSCLPESWRATPKAGFERMAAERLKTCVQNNPCQLVHWCFEQSWGYCLDAGYAKECGQAEPESTCGVGIE